MLMDKTALITAAQDYFKNKIAASHISNGISRASKLSNYDVHPFLFKYLACFLTGNADETSIAKALIYPRILGTSITTIFGSNTQGMMSEIFSGLGSMISGIDIEYYDHIDKRKKYCQVKAGPNTINKDDVTTILEHFNKAKGIARTNSLKIDISDLVVGVIYGDPNSLSSHYKEIKKNYPVYVGSEFWHRLTGDEDFYIELIDAIGKVALDFDCSKLLDQAITSLAAEIRASDLL